MQNVHILSEYSKQIKQYGSFFLHSTRFVAYSPINSDIIWSLLLLAMSRLLYTVLLFSVIDVHTLFYES